MTTSKKQTFWADQLEDRIVVSSGQGVTDHLGQFSDAITRINKLTLLRTIICHDYSYTIHDSGEGSAVLDIGIQVVSREALAAGVHPDPETELDFPTKGWIYRCRHKLHGFAADQASVDVRTVFRDIRAQRQINNGTVLTTYTNTPDSGTASSLHVVGITRMLFRVG